MTYAEYLRSQGATDEDIKVLDTPIGRKSFEAMQAATAKAEKLEGTLSSYETRVDSWYQESDAKLKETRARLTAAEADAARFRTALVSANRQGMINVAKDFGFTDEELSGVAPVVKKDVPANGFNPDQYFTRDDILKIANSEGEAIATAQDIAAEHVYLFGQPLRNFRELRQEAMTRKLPVEQVWKEKFNVDKARTDRIEKEQKERDDKIRLEARQAVEQEFAAKYSQNPDLRFPQESHSPFVNRPQGNIRSGAQPWEKGADALAADRVQRGTQTVLKTDFSKIPASRVM